MAYLIKNAQAVFSPTAADATDIRIRDGKITELGRDLAPAAGETQIDARGCVAWPGLVNTHHHLAQSIMRACRVA